MRGQQWHWLPVRDITVVYYLPLSSLSSSSSSTNFIVTQVSNKTSGPLCVTHYTTAVMSMLLWPIVCVAVWSAEQYCVVKWCCVCVYQSSCSLYTLVTYYGSDHAPGQLSACEQPTTSTHQFAHCLDRLESVHRPFNSN